jgi:hypothetical protein
MFGVLFLLTEKKPGSSECTKRIERLGIWHRRDSRCWVHSVDYRRYIGKDTVPDDKASKSRDAGSLSETGGRRRSER